MSVVEYRAKREDNFKVPENQIPKKKEYKKTGAIMKRLTVILILFLTYSGLIAETKSLYLSQCIDLAVFRFS